MIIRFKHVVIGVVSFFHTVFFYFISVIDISWKMNNTENILIGNVFSHQYEVLNVLSVEMIMCLLVF